MIILGNACRASLIVVMFLFCLEILRYAGDKSFRKGVKRKTCTRNCVYLYDGYLAHNVLCEGHEFTLYVYLRT